METELPSWWTDVERSRMNALAELESVMDVMETALADSGNKSSPALQIKLSRWSELVTASMSAAESLKRSIRLSESRRRDVQAAGFRLPVNTDFNYRITEASRRLAALVSETRLQMTKLSEELKLRQPRRRQMRQYRDNSPSIIDVHV